MTLHRLFLSKKNIIIIAFNSKLYFQIIGLIFSSFWTTMVAQHSRTVLLNWWVPTQKRATDLLWVGREQLVIK